MVFVLLFIGLIVGSFAVVVYYVSSSTQLKVNQSVYGVDTVVEAPSVVGTGDEIRSLITLVDSGELPEISYLSALSFENENYDIVGIYWDEEEMPAAYEGRFIDASMMGQAKVAAPRDIFEDKDAQVGDTFQFLRMGYFCKDPDSTDELPVFNRVVGLKDSFAKQVKG